MEKLTSKERDEWFRSTRDVANLTIAYDGQTMSEESYWRGIHERREARAKMRLEQRIQEVRDKRGY